jgi:hypothetical protein
VIGDHLKLLVAQALTAQRHNDSRKYSTLVRYVGNDLTPDTPALHPDGSAQRRMRPEDN